MTVIGGVEEPIGSGAWSDGIVPAPAENLVLDLTDFVTGLSEDGTQTSVNALMFEISDAILETADENILTAVFTGSMRTLQPGMALGSAPGAAMDELWHKETVALTATDNRQRGPLPGRRGGIMARGHCP